jgi:chromosome segregation ATPase
MFDSDIKTIGNSVEKFVKKVNNLNVNDDVYQIKNDIEELEGMYNDLNSQMDDCDNDLKDSSDSNTKPLINKLTQFRSDLDIAKNKLNSKKNSWQTNYNLEMLKEGKLSGYDKKKAERDIIIDQHKETDYQGDLIKGIGEHIKGSNQNMENINAELKQQGEQIINLQGTTTGISGKVSNTERVMTKIERRQVCGKVIGAIAIIVVGLADIAILVIKLVTR